MIMWFFMSFEFIKTFASLNADQKKNHGPESTNALVICALQISITVECPKRSMKPQGLFQKCRKTKSRRVIISSLQLTTKCGKHTNKYA